MEPAPARRLGMILDAVDVQFRRNAAQIEMPL
jgi:hypothetical protein